MARKRNQGNGQFDESLKTMQQALTQMLQAQANMEQNLSAQSQLQTAFLARMAESDAETAQLRRRMIQIDADIAETNRLNAQTFARIEGRFARIEAILAGLPEAVHRRFDFQPPRPPAE